jgi:CheY-like chemotaxis protein
MIRRGSSRRRALLVDSELDVRCTISRYLQLHGMDVVEVDTLHEATGRLAETEGFDLLVMELVKPGHSHWSEWKRLVTSHGAISLLIHGQHMDEWNEIREEVGRHAGFIGKPFTLSDFHWALHQLL